MNRLQKIEKKILKGEKYAIKKLNKAFDKFNNLFPKEKPQVFTKTKGPEAIITHYDKQFVDIVEAVS